jgi:hypothetical protein
MHEMNGIGNGIQHHTGSAEYTGSLTDGTCQTVGVAGHAIRGVAFFPDMGFPFFEYGDACHDVSSWA